MSIKLKLIISSIIFVTGLLFLVWSTSTSAAYVHALKDSHVKIEQFNKHILQLRKNEKDFFTTKNMNHVKEFKKNKKLLHNNIIDLEDALKSNNIYFSNELKKIHYFLHNYDAIFQKIVKQQNIIGLNENDGLYGDLRKSVHIVQNDAIESNNHKLLSIIYGLRKDEKDFMLRKNIKYIHQFKAKIDILLADDSLINDAMKIYLTDYKENLFKLVNNMITIGLNKDSGLHGKINSSVRQAEDLLKSLNTKLNFIITDKIKNTKQRNLTIVILIVLTTLISTLILLYSIRKPLNELTHKTKELKELNNNLEIIVEQKTKLANDQRDKAKAHTKAKGEFLANMSHEIRTPLNAILGFIGILKEEDIGRKSLEYIEIIDKSSKSLLQIIEDILDFSKIESGKLNIDKIYFNPSDEFRIITDLFENKCSQKNINLNINIDKNIPDSIKSDPLRIKQVISNLIGNSIKFTSSGKNIDVTIDVKDDMLNISVKDEGKGIAKDKLEHIFEAFNQEDNSTTREYGGTGLGLAISSKLIQLLDGELKVKSEVDEGSEFYFSIPVNIGRTVQNKVDKKQEYIFNDKKILLVEDNKSNQMLMTILFKKMKLEYEISNDGIEALEAFKENRYDLILMDENMPNMNGIEATKHILEYEKQNDLTHTPIIALTANALKGDRERFLKAGLDEYLSKPVDKNKLGKVLSIFF